MLVLVITILLSVLIYLKNRVNLKGLVCFGLLILGTGNVFAQNEINLRDFVRLNDIGIKIIDQKALKKHVKELELDKAQEKSIWDSVKKQKKEIKPELKEYNKLVFERRRQEETQVRMGGGSDSSNVPYVEKMKQSQESIHAKKEELIFNKKENEELKEETVEVISSLIPSRRANYPWDSEVSNNCNIESYIDPIFKDTTLQMNPKVIYDNYSNFLKSDEQPQAKCKMGILRERNKLFVVIDWSETSKETQTIWTLAKDDILSIVLEDGENIDLYYSGISRSAICNKDQTIQQFKAKYSLLPEDIDKLLLSPLKEISLFGEKRQTTLPIGKRWIEKPEDWKPSEFFITYVPCFN